MRFAPVLGLMATLLATPAVADPARLDARSAVAAMAPRAHAITWDKYSLKVDGQRVFSWGGDFHPFRVPARTCGATSSRR